MTYADEDVFKVIIHKDSAFEDYWDANGSEVVLGQLRTMHKKLSTQIAVFGDERQDWFKRVTALLVIVQSRIDEVKDDVLGELGEWKDFVMTLTRTLQDDWDKHDYEAPDFEDLDAIKQWYKDLGKKL